jgi:serine/threonine protein kinase
MLNILRRIQIPVEQIRIVMYKVISAVLAIHQLGFIHSDIKLDNIMIKENDIRLIDFGISKFIGLRPSHNLLRFLSGTPSTWAPDADNTRSKDDKESELNRISFASDVYSLGIIFIQLLTRNNSEFKTITNDKLLDFEKRNYFSFVNRLVGENGYDLILKMTNKNSIKRITLDDALNHPFFEGMNDEIELNKTLIGGGELNDYLIKNDPIYKNIIELKKEDFELIKDINIK